MRITLALIAVVFAGQGQAQDRALVIGNQTYANAASVTDADAAALSLGSTGTLNSDGSGSHPKEQHS